MDERETEKKETEERETKMHQEKGNGKKDSHRCSAAVRLSKISKCSSPNCS